MKKFILAVVFSFLLIGNTYASVDKSLEIYDALRESAIQLEMCTDENCNQGYVCSGIVIKENRYSTGILTARHCFEGKKIVKTLVNGRYKVIKIILADDIDVAYVEIGQSLLRFNPIPIAKFNVKPYNYVYYLGFPSSTPVFEIGIVFYNTLKNQVILMNSKGGCSGSGIVNENKKLVGVLWGRDTIKIFGKEVNRVIMTPIEKIKPFLIKLKIWNSILVK